jgi:shikimate kinase
MSTIFSNPNNIILIGYMGCGKSIVGKSISKKLNIPFEDLDNILVQAHKSSISELFIEHGDKSFRSLERNALLQVLDSKKNKVISLGGGTPCYHDNMRYICKNTPNVFYLKAFPSTLAKRLFIEKDNRPLISHVVSENGLQEFIGKHLFERQNYYNKAKHTISTDGRTINEIVEKIKDLL